MKSSNIANKYRYKIIRIINKDGCEGLSGRIGFCYKIENGALLGYWGRETLDPKKDEFEIVEPQLSISSKGGVYETLENAIGDFLHKAMYELDINETNPAFGEIVSALHKGLLFGLEGKCDLPMYGTSVCDVVEEEWLKLAPEQRTKFLK